MAIVHQWAADRVDADPRIEHATWQSRVIAHFAGQLFVRDYELPGPLKLAEDIGVAFVDMPFLEAIRYMEQRSILTHDEVTAILDGERRNAMTLRKGMSEALAKRILEKLQAAVGFDGPGLDEFIRGLQGEVVVTGATPDDARRYLEGLFRTTTAEAYGAGRFRQQTDPDIVEDESLVWEYLTVDDARVRPEHRALHGKQWPIGSAEGRKVYPPNGHRCRCAVIVTDAKDAQALERPADLDAAITPGFQGAPGEAG